MALDLISMMDADLRGDSSPRPFGNEMNIVQIDIDDLDEHPNNQEIYEMKDLSVIAESIYTGKLQSPLIVTPKGSCRYTIISGHRRFNAYRILYEKHGKAFQKIPCVIREYDDDRLAIVDMIEANMTARDMSDWERMRQAVEYEKVLISLKNSGKLKGDIRQRIAEKMNVGDGTIGRYLAIDRNLKNKFLRNLLRNGRIGVTVAYAMSSCSMKYQNQAEKEITNGNMELTLEWARQYKKWSEQEAEAERERMNPSFNFDVEDETGGIEAHENNGREGCTKENDTKVADDTEGITSFDSTSKDGGSEGSSTKEHFDNAPHTESIKQKESGEVQERPNTAHTREIKRAYEDIDEDLQELISEYEADEEMEQVWILESLRRHLAKMREWIGIDKR